MLQLTVASSTRECLSRIATVSSCALEVQAEHSTVNTHGLIHTSRIYTEKKNQAKDSIRKTNETKWVEYTSFCVNYYQ
jgi:hypothetical protein